MQVCLQMQYNINYMRDIRRDLTMHSHRSRFTFPLPCIVKCIDIVSVFLVYVGRSRKRRMGGAGQR